jgi:REP element-mobilizing transposase RayT
MSETWRKSHNISILIYHIVCPAKYRRIEFDDKVDEVLKETCIEIEKRYEIKILESGEFWTDGYYVSSVGQKGNEETVTKYVHEQGTADEYKQIHKDTQLKLF